MQSANENFPLSMSYTAPVEEFYFRVSKPPKWRLVLTEGFTYTPDGNMKVPNLLQRLMWRALFGFRWERILC